MNKKKEKEVINKFIERHIKEIKDYNIREVLKPYIQTQREYYIDRFTKDASKIKITANEVTECFKTLCEFGICNSYIDNKSIVGGMEAEVELVTQLDIMVREKKARIGVVFRNVLNGFFPINDKRYNRPIKDFLHKRYAEFQTYEIEKMFKPSAVK